MAIKRAYRKSNKPNKWDQFSTNKAELACDIQCINNLEKLNQMINFNVKTIKANHQGDSLVIELKRKRRHHLYPRQSTSQHNNHTI